MSCSSSYNIVGNPFMYPDQIADSVRLTPSVTVIRPTGVTPTVDHELYLSLQRSGELSVMRVHGTVTLNVNVSDGTEVRFLLYPFGSSLDKFYIDITSDCVYNNRLPAFLDLTYRYDPEFSDVADVLFDSLKYGAQHIYYVNPVSANQPPAYARVYLVDCLSGTASDVDINQVTVNIGPSTYTLGALNFTIAMEQVPTEARDFFYGQLKLRGINCGAVLYARA